MSDVRVIRVCLACAERHVFRWAHWSGACSEHRDTVPEGTPLVEHDFITAEEA